MTDTETSVLHLTEVAQLLSDADARRFEDAGMRRADLIAPAGSYARMSPRLINLEPTAPGADRYKRDLSKAIENYNSIHRLVFIDAIVTGQGTVVTRNSLLLHDSCWEMLANRITPAGLKYGADGNLAMANKASRRIERPSLLVKRPWWRNYGHWLVDSAAQLALMAGVMMPSDWQIVIGTYDDPAMRQIVQDTLTLLVPGIPVIEHADHETWVFSELHFIPPVSRPGLFKLPQGLAALRARILPVGQPRSNNKRLYISRGTDSKRRLTNNDSVAKLCIDRGFTIVEPENYSLQEQARLFQGAEIIVGVKGAALSNLIFATSSCAVVVLTPLGWGDTFFWDIAGQMGIEYVEIFGPSVPGDQIAALQPFTVDADDVAKTLDALIAARSGSLPRLIIGQSVTARQQDDGENSNASITGRWDSLGPAPVKEQQGARTAVAGTIMAHLAGIGDVSTRIGEWIGRGGSTNWIEGFQVDLNTDSRVRPLTYRGIFGPHEATPWATMSEYIGTRGQSLALRGICVDITASAGERYYCTYSAIFADGSHFDDVECGTPCHSPNWSALCALKINLYEIPEQRVGPRTEIGGQLDIPPAPTVFAPHETDNSIRPSRDEANASNVGTSAFSEQATALAPAMLSVPALKDVLESFLSLGDNCEFGLVQRQGGAEPVDLLRFATFFFPGQKRLQQLTDGLAARFSGLGDLETITCNYYEDRPPGEYIIRESAWGLFYHTGRNKSDIDAEKLRRQQVASLQMRVRKLLRELELGKRICVWKSNVGSDQEAIDRLVGRIRAYGPTLLLWVQTEDARHPSGTVEYAGAGLLKGYVGRFAPYDRAFEIDHPPWHDVCRAAASMRDYLHLSGVWPPPGSASLQDGGCMAPRDVKPITLLEAATRILWDERAAKAIAGTLSTEAAPAAASSVRHARVAMLSNIVFDATSTMLFYQGREIRETRYLVPNHGTEDVKINPIGLRCVVPDKLAIIGFNRGVTNSYHWIMQCLPALYRSVQMVGRDHCVLVLPDLARWQERTLAKLGLDTLSRIMVKPGRQYFFPRVIFAENLTGRGGAGVSPDMRAMFELLAMDMEPQDDEPNLIYYPPVRAVTPLDGQARELEAALRSQGFVTVGSASTRIDDQFRLFRNARVVIGHQGLGLVGLVFCRPGTKILEIQPASAASSRFAELAQSVGLDYHSLLHDPVATSLMGSRISSDDKPTLIEKVSSWLHQHNH